ncbi:MAG: glycerophosphodiester phosphodiesterase [Deltaproteobacteria bacterium]
MTMSVPRVLGHRGVPVRAPENTLAGFAAALAEGADGVELDVRCCATGELVVCHDATLARFTRGAVVRVAGTGAWALRQWDIGGGERVPLLAEVWPLMRGRTVNVEAKPDDGDIERLARSVAREVTGLAARGVNIIVSSFEPKVLERLRAIAPGVRRGLLLSDNPMEAADGAARARHVLPHAIHPHHEACTPERVRAWHGLGMAVYTWTVDAPDDVRRVVSAGVDGLITNRARETLALVRSRE